MNVSIENATARSQEENFEVINITLKAVNNQTNLDLAFESLKSSDLAKAVFWSFGKGSNHIWVSNSSNERLILITE